MKLINKIDMPSVKDVLELMFKDVDYISADSCRYYTHLGGSNLLGKIIKKDKHTDTRVTCYAYREGNAILGIKTKHGRDIIYALIAIDYLWQLPPLKPVVKYRQYDSVDILMKDLKSTKWDESSMVSGYEFDIKPVVGSNYDDRLLLSINYDEINNPMTRTEMKIYMQKNGRMLMRYGYSFKGGNHVYTPNNITALRLLSEIKENDLRNKIPDDVFEMIETQAAGDRILIAAGRNVPHN